jgi:hypothetical protein
MFDTEHTTRFLCNSANVYSHSLLITCKRRNIVNWGYLQQFTPDTASCILGHISQRSKSTLIVKTTNGHILHTRGHVFT